MVGKEEAKLCPKHGTSKIRYAWRSKVAWICRLCRREYECRRRRRQGIREYKAAPARELKWGKALLACRPPECELGRTILEAVRAGRTMRQIGEALGVSNELLHYYIRRLVERDAARVSLEKGLEALDRNLFQASAILTTKQIEAARMLLAGADQREAAKTLGVTQAAVASRLKYARKLLSEHKAPWAKTVSEGLETLGRTRNLSRFQLRGLSTSGRKPRMNEQKKEVVRETELTVEMSADELNFAVSNWAASQPEASEELKRLVAEGANISLTVMPNGAGAKMRIWREQVPQFRIGE